MAVAHTVTAVRAVWAECTVDAVWAVGADGSSSGRSEPVLGSEVLVVDVEGCLKQYCFVVQLHFGRRALNLCGFAGCPFWTNSSEDPFQINCSDHAAQTLVNHGIAGPDRHRVWRQGPLNHG